MPIALEGKVCAHSDLKWLAKTEVNNQPNLTDMDSDTGKLQPNCHEDSSNAKVLKILGLTVKDLLSNVAVTETTKNSGKMQVSTTDAGRIHEPATEAVLLSDNGTPGYVGNGVSSPARLIRKPVAPDKSLVTPKSEYAVDLFALCCDGDAIRGEPNMLAEALQEEEAEPGALGYQPFPVGLLPEPARSYVTASAAAIGCDPVFIALPLLAALASAIGNSRRVELKRTWTEPAILWAVVVAVSGGHKSPGFDAAMLPIRKRQEKATRQYTEAMNDYQSELEEYKQELSKWKENGCAEVRPPEPVSATLDRRWTDDTTIEALASLLLENPRGLLLSCDELSNWFGSFDRYSKAGTKGGGDAARWLPIHGGRPLVIDRKTGQPRTIYIPNATMSVAGGIQPGVLRRTLSKEHQESGMAARFLFAMPPKRQKCWTEAEIDESVVEAVLTLFDRLFALRPDTNGDGESTPRSVSLSVTAKNDFWVPYVNELGKEQAALDDSLSATWSKLEAYAARLALVHHLIRVAANDASVNNPDLVDAKSMDAGIALSRWFGQEAKRVFAMLSESGGLRPDRELCALVERLGGSVTANELRRHTRKYPTSDAAETAIQSLVKVGLGCWKRNPISTCGGRPTRTFVLHDGVKTL